MACETDAYTKGPRTSNDPYTVMTDEQIRNIKQVCASICAAKKIFIQQLSYLLYVDFYVEATYSCAKYVLCKYIHQYVDDS